MARLALVYGMRLLPSEDLGEVKEATVFAQEWQNDTRHHALN